MSFRRALLSIAVSSGLAVASVGLPVLSLPTAPAQAVTPDLRGFELTDAAGEPTAQALAGVEADARERAGQAAVQEQDAADEQGADAERDAAEDAGDGAGLLAGAQAAPRPGTEPAPLVTAAQRTDEFDLVAVTWDKTPGVDLAVEVRVLEEGTWSDWYALEVEDSGPDPGSEEARNATRAGTAPLFADGADGVQVRVAGDDAVDGTLPAGMKVELVDAGDSPTDEHVTGRTPLASADAAVGAPQIISRAQWGADERLTRGAPSYSATLKAATVHHTADTNNYDQAGAVRMMRSIYAYHTQSLQWSDVGYNFVVDKWGRIYEGRAGGIDKNVIGAHAGGFNTSTVGVSAIGNYETAAAPQVMVDAITRVIAWKLGNAFVDPAASVQLTSAGGSSSYPAGRVVTLPTVFAHRDVKSTACPGKNLYAQMRAIRTAARALVGPSLLAPTASATTVEKGAGLTVTAGLLTHQGYRLRVIELCTGREVAARQSSAPGGARVTIGWDGRGHDGRVLGSGAYRVELLTWAGSTSGLPYTFPLTVTGAAPPQASPAPVRGELGYVPVTPTRLLDTRDGDALNAHQRVDVPVLGRAGVPSSGVGAVALNVTGTCATTTTYLTVAPTGTSGSSTSAVNLDAGRSAAALVTTSVGSGGKVTVTNGQGSTDVVVDVVGYFPVSGGGRFTPLPASRVLDTRATGPVGHGQVRTVDVRSLPGGSSASAVMVNVTTTAAKGEGFVTAYAAGTAVPGTSTTNYQQGADVANRAIVPVRDGRIALYTSGSQAHVVVDVVGTFGSSGSRTFTPVAPVRALDTRSSGGALAAQETRAVPVAGTGRPLPAGVSAAVVTLTSTGTTARTAYVTAWASGQPRTATSDLNIGSGREQANLAVVPVGADGRINLYTTGGTHLVVDVLGYYR
ncbi:N-acetylmuramoyl-L-alanine amidase [Thalassiella azotivora]